MIWYDIWWMTCCVRQLCRRAKWRSVPFGVSARRSTNLDKVIVRWALALERTSFAYWFFGASAARTALPRSSSDAAAILSARREIPDPSTHPAIYIRAHSQNRASVPANTLLLESKIWDPDPPLRDSTLKKLSWLTLLFDIRDFLFTV